MNLHRLFCSTDAAMGPLYKLQLPILENSPTCNTAYNSFACIVVAAGADAAPCDDSGQPLQPCYDLCIVYALACKATGGIATLPSAPKNLSAFFPTGFQRLRSDSLCSLHFKAKNDQDSSSIS